jgi:hypothetical protein
MVKMKQIITFVVGLLFFSCSKEPDWKEAFQILEPFQTIELNSSFQVYLIQDSVYSLRIEADKDVVENIKAKVESGVLKIADESGWKWLRPTKNKVKLYISCNRPKTLMVNETCNIETINPIISQEFGMIMASKLNEANLAFQCSVVYFFNNHPMGGKITMRGTTDRLKLWPTALVQIDARDLQANVALVENSSKGDVHVRCTEALIYRISNIGNIYYHGIPNKFEFLGDSGKGELLPAE